MLILRRLNNLKIINTICINRQRFSKQIRQKNQQQIQKQHVYQVYDKIAQHFSQTRYKPWPRVANFLQHIKRGSIVLDVGCGNGRNMKVNSSIQIIGIDRCEPLLKIAKERLQNRQFVIGNILKLPIRSSSCDALICIALLHHLSSQKMRLDALKQLARVLKNDCEGLIYVRSMEILNNKNQLVRQLKEQDFFVPWHLQIKYEKNLQQSIEKGIQYIPQKNSTIYQRYYHVFVQGQLQSLINDTKLFEIKKSFYDKSNWACIVKKI